MSASKQSRALNEIDVAAVRADTPACEQLVHFNNAGASLMCESVYRTVVEHLELERQYGGYEAAARAADSLAAFYSTFARLLGAHADEIAYVENATRAWDMAFYALPIGAGDRIVTHESEYASNYLAFMQLARRRGLHIDVAPSDPSGQIDVDAMASMIGPSTKVVAITHVPSQGGLINPAQDVGRVAADHGLIYVLDACQSVGQLDVDVTRIGCHVLSGTGRKFLRGPRGTGFLYVNRSLLERLDPPFIDLHSAVWTAADEYEMAPGATRFENWESYVAGRLGLARAAEYAMALGLPAIEARVCGLAANLRSQLQALPGVQVHDRGARRCGIVTFSSEREAPERLKARLGERRMNISVTPASYAQLDLAARGLAAVARASVHYFNTDDEVAGFCAAVAGQ